MKLDTMKLTELRALARSKGITGKAAKQPKAQLIAALKALDTPKPARKSPVRSNGPSIRDVIASAFKKVGAEHSVDALVQRAPHAKPDSFRTLLNDFGNKKTAVGKKFGWTIVRSAPHTYKRQA